MTVAVRAESDLAKSLADRYFFETLIRLHRSSEGEGFTGLKPVGSVDPAIAAADRALADGNIDPFADKSSTAVRQGIVERFNEAHAQRQVAENSIQAGREYVKTYVQFTHLAEAIQHLTSKGASANHRENKEEAH